jgi:hypothetical protein
MSGWEGRNYPCFKKDRDPWARLSEQSFSSRHFNRGRHMDPQARSKRDQHAAACLVVRSDDFFGRVFLPRVPESHRAFFSIDPGKVR